MVGLLLRVQLLLTCFLLAERWFEARCRYNNQAKVFTEWFSGSLLMDQTLVYLVDKHPDFNVETTCFNSDSERWEPVCMPQLRNPELTD